MTLLAVAHNDKHIVIGSDTLTSVELNGARQEDIKNPDKVRAINRRAALGLSGYFMAESDQFIKDFCYNNRKIKDVILLRKALLDNVANTLTLTNKEYLEIILVGFSSGKPRIEALYIRPGAVPKVEVINRNFHTAGFNGPSAMAEELLIEKNVQSKPRKNELKRIIKATLNVCIDEFKSSATERLGGAASLKVLQKY